MNQRVEMVRRITELLNGSFRYGSYREEPTSLPYGNYAEVDSMYYYADNSPWLKTKTYIVRVITAFKDEELEDAIETVFEELMVPYRKVTEEDIVRHKVFANEWEIMLLRQ